MKRSPISSTVAGLLLACLALSAQDGPKEDDFLIFDKIEEDQRALPAAPAPPRTETAQPSQRPLPGGSTKATLRIILLEVPEKSFATGRLGTLTASASQRGTKAEPLVEFEGATVSLNAAIEKASAVIVAANPKFPDGVTLKVSVEGEYNGHERDAAAAATAILLDSVGTGRPLDQEAVLLGGVNEKGHLTAVQRLGTRLRTLEGPPPPVIGVPMESEVEVRDLALMGELNVLASLQVIGLVTLDDARVVMAKDRPEKVAKAFRLFASVREAAVATPVTTLLKNPKFLERLREITTLMPNHLSARLMLQAATGKVPGRITFATSRQAILKAIKPFVDVTRSNGPAKEIKTVATEGGNVLLRMQPKIHPSVERYLLAIKAYLRAVNNYLEIPASAQHAGMRNRTALEINKLLIVVQSEKEKLDVQDGTLK